VCERRAAVVLDDLPHMHVKAEEAIESPFRDQVSSFDGARNELIDCHSAGRNGDLGSDDVVGASGKMARERALSEGGSWACIFRHCRARLSSGSAFRISGFGFRVHSFRCRVQRFGFLVSSFASRVSSIWFCVQRFVLRASGFGPSEDLGSGPRRAVHLSRPTRAKHTSHTWPGGSVNQDSAD